MTSPEINFYQCDEELIKALAPLVSKIIDEKQKVLIYASDEKNLKEIDASLWSYGRNRFIAHASVFDEEILAEFPVTRQVVLFSNRQENSNQANYLVFLDEPQPQFIAEFARVFYFFLPKDFAKAKELAKKLKPKNSYKKEDGKWTKFSW